MSVNFPLGQTVRAVVKLFFGQEVEYFGWTSDEGMQFLPFDTGARFEILARAMQLQWLHCKFTEDASCCLGSLADVFFERNSNV